MPRTRAHARAAPAHLQGDALGAAHLPAGRPGAHPAVLADRCPRLSRRLLLALRCSAVPGPTTGADDRVVPALPTALLEPRALVVLGSSGPIPVLVRYKAGITASGGWGWMASWACD